MAGAKRRLVELEELSKLDEPIPNASVHGVLTSLSPMKGEKGNFFDGMISNGIGKTRLVGFNLSQKRSLSNFSGNREAVLLDNCEVKRARRGGCGMEVQLKGDTEIRSSPRRFNIPAAEFVVDQPKDIALIELQNLDQYERVNVSVKVLSIGAVEYVRTGHKKQDVVINPRRMREGYGT